MFQSIERSRRAAAVLLTLTSLSLPLSDCFTAIEKPAAVSDSGCTVNQTYDESKPFLTVRGESIQPDDQRLCLLPELGFGMLSPASWMEHPDALSFISARESYCIGFLPPSSMPDFSKMTEAELDAFDYVSILEVYQSFIASIEDIKNSLILFPAQDASGKNMISDDAWQTLSAKDMDGNTVTADVFASYDLTMVNIWTTWCGPCVDELPGLAKLHKDLPKNVNLITICADGAAENETARSILEKSGAGFVTLAGDETLKNDLLANVVSYPTTVFLDKNGTAVGSPFLGSWTAEKYMSEIQDRLKQLS